MSDDQNNDARDMWAEALSLLFKIPRKHCSGFQMMRLVLLRGCVRTDGQRQDRQKLTGICLFRGADIRLTFLVQGYCNLLTMNA